MKVREHFCQMAEVLPLADSVIVTKKYISKYAPGDRMEKANKSS